jgi:DNA-directed RNA polymerase specialized sigma subunit
MITQEQINSIADDPKAFLLQGKNAKELIAAKRERIEDWRKLAESISVTLKEDGGIGGSGYKQSIIDNAVCNIVDLENEILAEVEALVNVERDIRTAIDQFTVDERHKTVLEMRYLNGYSWKAIASKLYYGEDWVCRLHGAALQEMRAIAKYFGEEVG